MNINEWVETVHNNAKDKGFWDTFKGTNDERLSKHMLMVSELAEATESVRKGEESTYWDGPKPEGEAVELADCAIRIMDYFGQMKWDLEAVIVSKHNYNVTRERLHGKKL